MGHEAALDIHALIAATEGDSELQRKLVLAFIGNAESCLSRLAELMVRGDSAAWSSTIRELESVANTVHANRLQEICNSVLGETVSTHPLRLGAYMQMKEAYEAVVLCARNAGLLVRPVNGGF